MLALNRRAFFLVIHYEITSDQTVHSQLFIITIASFNTLCKILKVEISKKYTVTHRGENKRF